MPEFKKGDRVKIEPQSQAALEIIRDEKALKKWESANWIGFVVNVTKAPAGNPLVRVGIHPDDKNGDYFFPGDLRTTKPEEGAIFLVFSTAIDNSACSRELIAVCTDFHTAQEIRNQNPSYRFIEPVLINKRI